jgi:hypothetical protein
MSDEWDELRSRWENIRQAVDDALLPSGSATLGRGRISLSTNPVAVTGEAGAGKTVLYDALVQGIKTGDRDSTRSRDREEHRAVFAAGSRRSQASVEIIPGQQSKAREEAQAATMEGTASPHGIIHVACWGHNRVWQLGEQRAIDDTLRGEVPTVDLESVRAWHLRKELAGFQHLCEEIVEGRVARRLRWLIVAVTKCDLYWDRIDEARDYYLPGGSGRESEFAAALRELVARTSVEVAVLPMSSRLIRHQFLPRLRPQFFQLDDTQLGVLRTHFCDSLQRLLVPGPGGAPRGGR